MLAIKDISKLIANPTLSHSNNVDQLKEYSKKFPYSSLLSILYLKSLRNSSSIQFDDELVKHSYRISDRIQLYNIIQQHSTSEEDEEEVLPDEGEIIETLLPITSPPEIIEENETLSTEDSTPIEEKNKVEVEKEQIVIQSIEKEKETEDNSIQKKTDVVDESILQHAFSANYQLSELNNEEIIELNQKNNSPRKVEEKEEEKTKDEITIDTKQSFKSWLSANNSYTHLSDEEKPHIPDLKKDTAPVKTKKELLEETRKPKKAFFSPTKKAKESLNEDVLPVSETLAKIYALQGNFPKAISAYMQLSLINPEKKIFFALRIKELEQKLKHK